MIDPIAALADNLMRSVVRTGCLRPAPHDDATVACRVMREELKSFLTADKYADERALVQTGGSQLAYASLTTECVRRILGEREG